MNPNRRIILSLLVIVTIALVAFSVYSAIRIVQDTSVQDACVITTPNGPTGCIVLGPLCSTVGLSRFVKDMPNGTTDAQCAGITDGRTTIFVSPGESCPATGETCGKCVRLVSNAGHDVYKYTGDCAPTNITISGSVICQDPGGTAYPIPGYNIVFGNGGGQISTTQSRSDGTFTATLTTAQLGGQFAVRIDSALASRPTGNLSNGRAISALTAPTSSSCSTQSSTGCSGTAFTCSATGTYEGCGVPSTATSLNNFRFVFTGCAVPEPPPPPPPPPEITVSGRVVCQDPGGNAYAIENHQVVIAEGTTVRRTVVTGTDGRFTTTFDSSVIASDIMSVRLSSTRPNGVIAQTGQALSALVSPLSTSCSPQAQTSCSGSAYACSASGNYEGCNVSSGTTFSNFNFTYTNCTPGQSVCGGSCTVDLNCPSGTVCSAGTCKIPGCINRSDCLDNGCTLPPNPACGVACASNANCPAEHVCSSGTCKLAVCVGRTDCLDNGCRLPVPGGNNNNNNNNNGNNNNVGGTGNLPNTAIFDDEKANMVFYGIILILAGIFVFKFKLGSGFLANGFERFFAISDDNLKLKLHKKKLNKNRSNFEKRFEK